jgi:hypothetical protein
MSSAAARIALACVLTIAVTGVARAQSSQASPNAQNNTRKNGNQVPDSGLDAPQQDQGSSFERVISAVPVRVRPDGTVVAELDDAFMEATTVTIGANGRLILQHFTGLDRAERAARLLPSRVLPPLFPVVQPLEEKE